LCIAISRWRKSDKVWSLWE